MLLFLAINRCHPNPCYNGGMCHDHRADYECICADGFMGKTCQRMYTVYILPSHFSDLLIPPYYTPIYLPTHPLINLPTRSLITPMLIRLRTDLLPTRFSSIMNN